MRASSASRSNGLAISAHVGQRCQRTMGQARAHNLAVPAGRTAQRQYCTGYRAATGHGNHPRIASNETISRHKMLMPGAGTTVA
jgi:hypothetical protein